MSSGTSVTDIAAKISLDYSAYMQGIKVIESRAVDMAKFIATPLYPEKPADAYSAHIRDAMINAKNEYEIAALRQRIIEKEQGERDRDFILFKEDLKRREDEANEHYRRMERDNKVNAERMASFRQKQTETMFANIKFPDNLNSDANYQGLKRQLEAEQEYANAEERRQEEREKRRQRAIELDKKAYEEGKRIQRQAGTDYVIRRNNDKKIDEQVTAAQKQAAEELTSLLDKQKAKNDEIYAQHLRDRKARSEMAAALKAGREAGISNNVLKAMADEFRMQQEIEKRNRLQEDDNDLKLRAERILRSMMTAQDLHNERVKEYTMLLSKGKFTQKQFNDAVEASKRVMTASNAGAGRFSGAMTQLSFAAEDFIQVSAMGGGLNMALMSASNNMSMFVRAMLPAAGLLSSLAGAVVPLAAIGIGMYVQKTMQAKDSTEALNKELERFLRNAQQDLRLQALFSFEDTQNVSSASEAMSRAADASREMKKAQLEQKLAQNAVNSSLESFIMSLEEARKLTNAPLASEEFEYYQMAFEEYKRAFNEVMNSGMKTEQDARTALTRYMTSLSQYPTIFAEQIDLIRKILNDPEGNALEAFRQLEEQNARLFNAQQEMEESRKRALDLARQELQMRQEEEMLVLRMNEEEKQRYDLAKQQKEFVGFDPMAVAGLGLAGILNAGQGMAAGMQFLEARAANLEKEIAALQQSSSPEVIGGMQQDAFQAQADAFKQIFAAENKQPNPQLTRQIQLLTDIRAAMVAGGIIKVVGQ